MIRKFPWQVLACALIGGGAHAQSTPATAQPPNVRAVAVAQQSAPSFLESMAIGPDNAVWATDFQGRQILRYEDDKGFSVQAQLDVHPWGMLAWRPGDGGPFAINDGGFIAPHWYGGPAPAASNLVRLHGLD